MENSQKILIQQVAPNEIRSVWDRVKPGIEHLLLKCPDDYIAEDVYWFLRENRATLFMVGDGFMVLEVATDIFSGKKSLCVWLLHFLGAEESRGQIYEYLDDLARKAGCCRVRFKSPRSGWVKKAIGWDMKLITWEREIQ